MKRFAIVSACLLSGLVVPSRALAASAQDRHRRATVQIAILLDTSNSMDGLIAQAKTQLWNVVNEFVKAKKDGRPPAIQVALFEYGKQTLSPNEGFVRLILPLTDDLDRVSEELFALEDERRRRILRLGDPRGRQTAGVERVRRRVQGHLHRRQRAVHAGVRRFPRLMQGRDRARDRRQHDLLRAERRRRQSRLEGRGDRLPTAGT